eukprot:gene3720-3982_t
MALDSFLSKIVNSITGEGRNTGKDYWVDDAKVKACYECETPFTLLSILPPVVAGHRMRQRDDDGNPDRTQAGVAHRLLLGSMHGLTGAQRLSAAGAHGATSSSSSSGMNRHAVSPTKLQQVASLSRSSGTDGSLTWEVPPALERSFGPCPERSFGPSQEAVAASAQFEQQEQLQEKQQELEHVMQDGKKDGNPLLRAADAAASDAGPVCVGSRTGPFTFNRGSPGLHPLVQLNVQEFSKAADEHLELLLHQLLVAEDVADAESWLPIVLQLASEAARCVLPAAAAAFGEQDPRFYVKVKRLPDMGSPADSCVIHGVVAKKNVAHRRMRTDIVQPSVLLLAGALEYQRVANKLSSFDTLLEQEKEHLRLAVARIAACKPDLLLVERSVARSAQEELLLRNISLVQHNKPELLERLARCMGVKVAASVEELTPQLIGTCNRFRVDPLPALQPPMLLWGASASELTKLKRVVKFGVLAVYHLSLENTFLAEELALATAALASAGVASSGDAEVFRSLARATISSSLDAVNPLSLKPTDRLLLAIAGGGDASKTGAAELEPVFTDPLRRQTWPGDDSSDEEGGAGEEEGAGAEDQLQHQAVMVLPPLWLQGLKLYDRRGLMCEPPAVKRIDYYCHSDLSLAGFIVAAAPHTQKRCQVPGCGDGVTCHVRTFLHGSSRITLSIATLPAAVALPGEERGQVWTWLRPKGSRRPAGCIAVRRLPLSQASACMSFGMFLSLCFAAPGLEVFGHSLHSHFVRYFGLGRTVMCLHQDSIFPSAVVMPELRISYSLNAQLMWLKQEAAELCQVSETVAGKVTEMMPRPVQRVACWLQMISTDAMELLCCVVGECIDDWFWKKGVRCRSDVCVGGCDDLREAGPAGNEYEL